MHTEQDVQRNIPRYALWKGQRVHVLYYAGNNSFMVVDKHDDKRKIHRNQLTFVKGNRK